MTDRPPRRRGQATLMRVINVPMRRILALPFPTPLSKRLMLLYLTGRPDLIETSTRSTTRSQG
jgi:hypothetical protein